MRVRVKVRFRVRVRVKVRGGMQGCRSMSTFGRLFLYLTPDIDLQQHLLLTNPMAMRQRVCSACVVRFEAMGIETVSRIFPCPISPFAALFALSSLSHLSACRTGSGSAGKGNRVFKRSGSSSRQRRCRVDR